MLHHVVLDLPEGDRPRLGARAPGALQGHVVDFISVFGPNAQYFPVFNFADSAICVGGALIVLMAIIGRDYDGRSTREAKTGE